MKIQIIFQLLALMLAPYLAMASNLSPTFNCRTVVTDSENQMIDAEVMFEPQPDAFKLFGYDQAGLFGLGEFEDCKIIEGPFFAQCTGKFENLRVERAISGDFELQI